MRLIFALLAAAWAAPVAAADDHHHGHAMPAKSPGKASALFPTKIPKGASFVKASEDVVLKDGDTYALTAKIVKQRIGGRLVKRFAYNGMIPGPVITVTQGAKVKIVFKNETDVETTLHSHGLRTDYRFDGVPGVGQDPVKPGGTFTYELTFPDAGTFWYHPHIREDYAQEMGLYGNYRVAPKDATGVNPVDRHVNLVVDDLLIEDGKMPAFYKDKATHAAMGRFGNVFLVNDDPRYAMKAAQGDVVRFAVTNAANTRTFRLRFAGARMKLVGGDAGLHERDAFVDDVTLAPSERAIVEVLFDKPGVATLEHVLPDAVVALGQVTVAARAAAPSEAAKAFGTLTARPEVTRAFAPMRALLAKEPAKRVTLGVMLAGEHAGHAMGGKDPIEWRDDMPGMNAAMGSDVVTWKVVDDATKKENMDIAWEFRKGEAVKIRIFNDPKSAHPMQHPIHFHGQRFVVLARDGKPNDNMVWKDTVLVKNGETVDIGLDASNPGKWMGHCHIAEHLSAGMMFGFSVTE